MKQVNEMTLVGLVIRLVKLKAEIVVINLRRSELRKELLDRLEAKVPVAIAGYRVIKTWVKEYSHTSTTKAHWEVRISRPSTDTKQHRL